MFFKKKKPKLDPKVRFQNRQFNQKLQQARTFKRNVIPVPDSKISKFLKSIGLGSAWRQIGFALFVLAVLYTLYYPNFLTLQNIEINGIRSSDKSTVEAMVRDNISQAPFYNPQRNLLFLSKSRVESVLNEANMIDSVATIKKDFKTHTLRIVVVPKQEQFLVRSNDAVYVVYNDGSLKFKADRSLWETNPNDRLIKIDVPANISLNEEGKNFLAQNLIDYVKKLSQELKMINGSPLAYISIPITEDKKAPAPEVVVDEPENTNSNANSNSEGVIKEEPVPDAVDKLVAEENSVSASNIPENNPIVEIQTPVTLEELNIYLAKGGDKTKLFKVLFSHEESPKVSSERLNLLLSQTAADRYAALNYIDLRINNRAFICLLNTTCSK